MRRTAITLSLLATALCAPVAQAHDGHGPDSHGPDPEAIDAGADLPRRGTRARAANASTSLPTTWCGDERATDQTQNELGNGDFRYHAVYAVAADAPSRLQTLSGQIQTDAMRGSALLEQLYGRAIRYDMGTSCGSQYIDISVVRLPQTTAELQGLAGTGTGTLNAVANALDAQGFPVIKSGDSFAAAAARRRNWIVWLDAPAPGGACGQAMLYDDPSRDEDNYNNLGGKVAIVFEDGDGGFCGANTVRHEVAHNLGAVVSRAPHSNGGHCTDAVEDTMCVPNAPRVASGAYHELYFDYGNDDYWDPPNGSLPWWTVNLSRFLCPDAGCNVTPGYVPPAPPATDDDADAPSTSKRARRARIRVSRKRTGRNRWRLTVRLAGSGRGTLYVRCRRSAQSSVRTAARRSTKMPRTVRMSVRCASRPTAVAYYGNATASGKVQRSSRRS